MALTQVDQGLLGTYAQYTGFKNRIINGAMDLSQRGTSSVSVSSTTQTFSVDRWWASGQATDGVFTMQQTPSATETGYATRVGAGFTNYLAVTVTTADTSIGATQRYYLAQRIEAFNTADLAWGTANAKTVTLSFLAYSSLTGTFGGFIYNSAADYSYPFTYSIPTANTWTQISVTIAPPTAGTWLGSTNGIGMQIGWSLGAGSTYLGTAGSWASAQYFGATGQTNVIGTNGATFYITGVQLEKGSTATSFDYRPYTTELTLCQRYYFKIGANSQANSNYQAFGSGGMQTPNTSSNIFVPFKQTMRVTPTVTYGGSLGLFSQNAYNTITNIASTYAGADSMLLQTNNPATGTAGYGAVLLANADATAYLAMSSEL
jgi:hypothetical protein